MPVLWNWRTAILSSAATGTLPTSLKSTTATFYGPTPPLTNAAILLLPMGNDNAWIIGATYNSYGRVTENIVDQLKGEPFRVDLLDKWHPQSLLDRNVQADAYRVAENAFLILAVNDQKQYAPLLVNSSGFSLLPMEQPLPMEGPWGAIRYMSSFWTVPETETAWLMGLDEQNHVYLAEIAYQPALHGGQTRLSMYYSQPMKDLPGCPYELLLPDGSFITVGGMNQSNYDSSAAVFAFYPAGALIKCLHTIQLPFIDL